MELDAAPISNDATTLEDPQAYLRSHLPELNISHQVARNPNYAWPVATGGFADIWKGVFTRKEVAIKVARVYSSHLLLSAQKVNIAVSYIRVRNH
jgi:hypothetical protein